MRRINIILLLLYIPFFLNSLDIETLVKQHPVYRQNITDYESTKYNISSIKIRKLPLNANISTKTFGAIIDPEFNYSIGVDINYLINNPDLHKELILSEQDLLIKTYKLKTVYEQINYKMTKLALDYISSQNIKKHVINSYESINSYTKKVADRFNSGDLSKSEKLFADSVLLKNKASLIDAEFIEKITLEQFFKELGQEVNKEIILLFVNQIYSVKNILLKNNSLNIMELEYKKSKMAQELTKGYSTPKVSLSGLVKYPFNTSTSWQFGINVSVPIFGKKLDDNIRNEYSFNIESLQLQSNRLKNEIKNNIALIDNKIININNKLELYKEALKVSKLSLDGILIESNAGVRTVFDVISANNSLADIEQIIIEQENELLYLYLEKAYITGGLLEN